MRPSPHVSYPFWAGVPCRLRPQGSEAGAGHEPPGASVPLPQNCGSPSILDGPGPFTVFVPSNEAVDRLRDGRLIYLFTAVSWREGLWEGEAPAPPALRLWQPSPLSLPGSLQTAGAGEAPHLQPQPGERPPLGASQVPVCPGPSVLAIGTATARRRAPGQGGSCEPLGRRWVWPQIPAG